MLYWIITYIYIAAAPDLAMDYWCTNHKIATQATNNLSYCIAGKFGEVFNLVIWQSRRNHQIKFRQY